MLVMGLVLGPSLMVISIMGIQKYLLFIMYCGSELLLFTRKLNCLQISHIPLWNPTCVQSFRFEVIMVFEIQGLKLKNKKRKNWRNEPFAISPMIVVQILGVDLGYHSMVSKVDYH